MYAIQMPRQIERTGLATPMGTKNVVGPRCPVVRHQTNSKTQATDQMTAIVPMVKRRTCISHPHSQVLPSFSLVPAWEPISPCTLTAAMSFAEWRGRTLSIESAIRAVPKPELGNEVDCGANKSVCQLLLHPQTRLTVKPIGREVFGAGEGVLGLGLPVGELVFQFAQTFGVGRFVGEVVQAVGVDRDVVQFLFGSGCCKDMSQGGGELVCVAQAL